jgi:hypothetical protein
VEVPEWDGVVWVKTMTIAEREEVGNALSLLPEGEKRDQAVKPLIVMAAMVDENGERLFPDFTALEHVSQTSGAAIQRVFLVADRMNSVTVSLETTRKN